VTESDYFGSGQYAYQVSKVDAASGYESARYMYDQTTGKLTEAMYFDASTHKGTQDIKFNLAAGPWSTEIMKFNSSGKEIEDDKFNAATGAVQSVTKWDGVNPYATEVDTYTGTGGYASQINKYNPTTGVITAGATFNSTTGSQTSYYYNGGWNTGGNGTSFSFSGWVNDQDDGAIVTQGELNIDVCGGTPDGSCGCPDGVDPIILNLKGDSVQTTSANGSSTYFDMQNNGEKVQTGWGTAGEGYLVYDPDDAGYTTAITKDSQLIGGFDALRSLVQQVDGTVNDVVTSGDAIWNDLKVWVDTTGTGTFQEGQLLSFAQLGITSIDLNGVQVNRDSNGNEILVDSTFTRADGTMGDIAGVNLKYNAYGTPSGPAGADASAQQTDNVISNMVGYGAQTAMDLSPDFITGQVQNLISNMAAMSAQTAMDFASVVAAAKNDPQMLLAASAH